MLLALASHLKERSNDSSLYNQIMIFSDFISFFPFILCYIFKTSSLGAMFELLKI